MEWVWYKTRTWFVWFVRLFSLLATAIRELHVKGEGNNRTKDGVPILAAFRDMDM